jgi:DNA invertase Pin-like site-specific DNA recombinase
MVNNILVEVLASIAQQERETIKRRQAEGIEAARAQGKQMGRPKAQVPDNWTAVLTAWRAGALTAVEAMKQTGLKKSTFYKLAAADAPQGVQGG